MLDHKWENFLSQPNITTPNNLEIRVEQGGTSTNVGLKGRVDVDSSPDLRDRLLEVLQRQSSDVITVDLSDVPYIDTSGMATLIEALKIARHHQKSFFLQGLTGSVLRLFELTGVLALFKANSGSSGSSAAKES